jgi:hypothetical protein
VKDCGGIPGWEEVKRVFGAGNSTVEQRKKEWARAASGLDDRFDPFKEPDVKVMNYEGRWENHFHEFMRMSGEQPPEFAM